MSILTNIVGQLVLVVNGYLGFDKKLKISVHLPTDLPFEDLMVDQVILKLMLNYRSNRLKKYFFQLKQKFYPY